MEVKNLSGALSGETSSTPAFDIGSMSRGDSVSAGEPHLSSSVSGDRLGLSNLAISQQRIPSFRLESPLQSLAQPGISSLGQNTLFGSMLRGPLRGLLSSFNNIPAFQGLARVTIGRDLPISNLPGGLGHRLISPAMFANNMGRVRSSIEFDDLLRQAFSSCSNFSLSTNFLDSVSNSSSLIGVNQVNINAQQGISSPFFSAQTLPGSSFSGTPRRAQNSKKQELNWRDKSQFEPGIGRQKELRGKSPLFQDKGELGGGLLDFFRSAIDKLKALFRS